MEQDELYRPFVAEHTLNSGFAMKTTQFLKPPEKKVLRGNRWRKFL